jgi:hypothetical protein
MIISASRRTDIPAFFANWFMRRIREGFCMVPNPFNPSQIATIDLTPPAVDVIVFWTRFPQPLFPFLDELDRLGYRYYFQYTILNNPREIDPRLPDLNHTIQVFCQLSERLGPERVIWRYDPILFSSKTDTKFHLASYRQIAEKLYGFTKRSVISILDYYPKTFSRLNALAKQGITLTSNDQVSTHLVDLIPPLVKQALNCGMEVFSCAEPFDLKPYGVQPGKCVDADLIRKIFQINVIHEKDPSQRRECGCVKSRDIGVYNTCLFGCAYCYATQDFERARHRYKLHNPDSTSLS